MLQYLQNISFLWVEQNSVHVLGTSRFKVTMYDNIFLPVQSTVNICKQISSRLINLLTLSMYDYMVTPWTAQFLQYVVENK